MSISIRYRCLAFILLLVALPSLGYADTGCQLTLPAIGHTHERTIEIWGVDHGVDSPRDAATGLPSGKRRHAPFTVVKRVDASSGGLMEALFSGAPLPDRVLVECAVVTTEAEQHFYTIELLNATVAGIHTEFDSDARSIGSLTDSPLLLEEVTLAYEGIQYRIGRQGGHMTVVEDYEVGTASADSLR